MTYLKNIVHKIITIIFLVNITIIIVFSSAYQQEDSDHEYIISLYQEGTFELAKEKINNFKYQFPKSSYIEALDYLSILISLKIEEPIESIAQCKKFLSNYPNSRFYKGALVSLGKSYYFAKKYKQAKGVFERLLVSSPYSSFSQDSLYWLAEIAFIKAEYNTAEGFYERYLKEQPYDGEYSKDALYNLSRCFLNQKKYSIAIEYFDRFIDNYHPTSQELLLAKYYKAISFYKDKQYVKSETLLRKVINTSSQESHLNSNAKFYLAECLYKQGNYLEAESYYHAVVSCNAKYSLEEKALYGLGWSQFAQKKYLESVQSFSHLTNRFPTSNFLFSANYQQALALEYLGKHKESETKYKKIISDKKYSKENIEKVRFAIIRSNFKQKKFKVTIDLAQEYINLNPKGKYLDVVIIYLAESFYAQGLIKEAEGYFLKITKECKQSLFLLDAYYKLGQCYQRQGKFKLAEQTFNYLLKKFPHSIYHDGVVFSLAEISFEMGNYDNALKYYRQIFDKKEIIASLKEKSLYGLAWTLFKLERYQESLKKFRLFQENYPNNNLVNIAIFKQGECLANLKELETAQETFKGLLKIISKNYLYKEANYQIGNLYYKMEKFELAIDKLTSLTKEIYPSYNNKDIIIMDEIVAKSFFLIGWSYYRLENYDKSYEYFSRVNENTISGNNKLVRESYIRQADSLYNLRDLKKALLCYDKMEVLPGKSFEKDGIYGSFLCYLELKNFDKAKEIWIKFNKKYPRDPLVQEMDEKLIESKKE